MSDISDSENEVDIVEETLNVGCVTNKEFLKLTTSTSARNADHKSRRVHVATKSPFPWEGTGEADGLPSPLSPTHKLRTAAPVAHRTWDWAVCRNALWVNRLWSAIYPFHSWGLDRSLPRSLLARRQERCYTAHRSPVPGGPLRCVTRIGPPKGTLTSSARVPLASPVQIIRQLRGAVCSLNLWGPKTRTPSTFRGRLTPARRPRSRPLPQAIAITTSCPLSLSFTLPGHYFGELSAPLVQNLLRLTIDPVAPRGGLGGVYTIRSRQTTCRGVISGEIESSRPQSPNLYPSDVEPSKSLRHPTRYGCSALGWCPTKHPCRSPHPMKQRPSPEGGRAATRPRSHVMKKPRRFPRRQSHVGPFLCILVFHCNVENLPTVDTPNFGQTRAHVFPCGEWMAVP
ncbi:hypothetical protein GEV33_002554 [Tenebrio molitor]|uniref:Uncharacterized protein n=1 Tax=Tenebrio molitor TaxID=7067 RepID=A0A8J6LIP4_TENMO|nr:hypothetical protein GEV33_002554 [Tenebrio molitor]